MSFSKLIDWDVFRDVCRYRNGNECRVKEFGVKSCSVSNRGAMKQCGFWKALNEPKDIGVEYEKFEGAKKKKFKECFKEELGGVRA